VGRLVQPPPLARANRVRPAGRSRSGILCQAGKHRRGGVATQPTSLRQTPGRFNLPPRRTLHGYFELWEWDGTLARMHHALYEKCREQASREASPTVAIIDSQSVKSAEKGCRLDRPPWL
jgi:hypothetical protein